MHSHFVQVKILFRSYFLWSAVLAQLLWSFGHAGSKSLARGETISLLLSLGPPLASPLVVVGVALALPISGLVRRIAPRVNTRALWFN